MDSRDLTGELFFLGAIGTEAVDVDAFVVIFSDFFTVFLGVVGSFLLVDASDDFCSACETLAGTLADGSIACSVVSVSVKLPIMSAADQKNGCRKIV